MNIPNLTPDGARALRWLLDFHVSFTKPVGECMETIQGVPIADLHAALRAALEQPAPEPAADGKSMANPGETSQAADADEIDVDECRTRVALLPDAHDRRALNAALDALARTRRERDASRFCHRDLRLRHERLCTRAEEMERELDAAIARAGKAERAAEDLRTRNAELNRLVDADVLRIRILEQQIEDLLKQQRDAERRLENLAVDVLSTLEGVAIAWDRADAKVARIVRNAAEALRGTRFCAHFDSEALARILARANGGE